MVYIIIPLYDYEDNSIRIDELGIISDNFSGYDPFKLSLDLDYNNLKIIGYISEKNKEGNLVYKNESEQASIICCCIKCIKEEEMLLNIIAVGPCKLWINDKLIALSDGQINPLLTTVFREGINYCCLEFGGFIGEKQIGLRINSVKNESENKIENIICENLLFEKNQIFLYTDPLNCINKDNLKILLLPFYLLGLNINQVLQIDFINDKQEKIDTIKTKFYKVLEYNLSLIKKKYNETFIYMKISCLNRFSKTETLTRIVLLKEPTAIIEKVKLLAEKVLLETSLDEIDKTKIIQRLREIEELKPPIAKLSITLDLRDQLISIKKGRSFKNLLYRNTPIKYTFFSKLDQTYENLTLCPPMNFDVSKKYPLFICLATSRYSSHSSTLGKYLEEDVLFVDISGRGVTLGSYIGEAAILESIEVVCSCFNIDRRRIYLAGISNGAFACWALAQNYPHLFAAIIPISGKPIKSSLKNLTNTKIFNITSLSDYLNKDAYQVPNEYYNNVDPSLMESIVTSDLLHFELLSYLFKRNVIKKVLSVRKELFPFKISFYSERNRHLKCYWIEIFGIERGEKYVDLQAQYDLQGINVDIENAIGLNIEVPPILYNKKFSLTINKKVIDISKSELPIIKLSLENGEYHIITDDFNDSLSLSRKGTGILDVYLGELCIIIPSQHNKLFEKVGYSFSSPFTNGFERRIHACYPIFSYENFPLDYKHNMIIIEISEKICPFFIEKHITTLKDKFIYKNKEYIGRYCCMQVIPNPINNKASILHIYCNDIRLLEKNIFIRKVIIPSYSTGIHPYLNNEALIYYNNKYFGIYEFGDDMIEI